MIMREEKQEGNQGGKITSRKTKNHDHREIKNGQNGRKRKHWLG